MIFKEWKTYKLGQIVDDIAMGPFGSNIKVDNFIEIGVPVIRGSNLNEGGFVDEKFVFISEEKAQSLKRSLAYPDDLVFTHRGTIGQVGIIPHGKYPKYLVSQSQMKLTVNRKFLYPKFLYYFFKSSIGQYELLKNSSQVGVPAIASPTSSLKEVTIAIPDLIVQRRIADTLSALDDKIELNRQINATLEAIAQAIFKEWFVDFRFPGAAGEMQESELGMIPHGWEVLPLETICQRITDGSHFSPKTVEIGYPMASVKDMNHWGIDLKNCRNISKQDFDELVRNDCKPLKDDVLIAKDGSYLKHIFVVEDYFDLVILSSIAILRPNNLINPHILANILKQPSVLERMKNYVSGAALQRIVLKDFRQFKVVIPPIELQKKWYSLCEPLIKLCWHNNHENDTLADIRDILLWKLMKGELEQ